MKNKTKVNSRMRKKNNCCSDITGSETEEDSLKKGEIIKEKVKLEYEKNRWKNKRIKNYCLERF